MKKFIILIIICIFCTVVASGIFYQMGFKNAKKEYELKSEKEIEIVDDTSIDEAIGQLDYPLIDIAFNDGNEYAVVISNDIYSEKQTYLLCADGRNLQFNTEHLYIRTYPAGRGTTGNGAITVYKNGEEIRYIEFLEINFTNEDMKNSFVKVSSEELNDYLNAK
ncbi:MAG: hypothetical protein IKW04_00515 [Clostridia bacterium]|nr:hypothetical protein [Clostridia bacterium]